jgi:hypothetical protein
MEKFDGRFLFKNDRTPFLACDPKGLDVTRIPDLAFVGTELAFSVGSLVGISEGDNLSNSIPCSSHQASCAINVASSAADRAK